MNHECDYITKDYITTTNEYYTLLPPNKKKKKMSEGEWVNVAKINVHNSQGAAGYDQGTWQVLDQVQVVVLEAGYYGE